MIREIGQQLVGVGIGRGIADRPLRGINMAELTDAVAASRA